MNHQPGQAHSDWKSKAPSCLSAVPRPQQSAGRVLQEGDLFTLYVGSTGTTWDRDWFLGITAAMAGKCKSVLLKATVNILKLCWFVLSSLVMSFSSRNILGNGR